MKGFRILLGVGLAALGVLAFVFNVSGHRVPFSTNLAFTAIALILALMFIFPPRFLR